MKLGSILDEHLVFTDVRGNCRQEIYTNLLQMAAEHIELPATPVKLVDDMIHAESASGVNYGKVAMPHLRRPDFGDLYIIVGRLPTPVKILPDDPAPSQLVIMSLINPETSDVYLKALAALSRYLLFPANLEKVMAAADGETLIEQLKLDNVTLKKNLTAEDVMTAPAQTVSPDDNLSAALDIFNSERRMILPVVDADGKLVGELDSTEIIHKFIPEYIFMMESTKFLVSFEPFEQIFRSEHKQKVRDLMQEPKLVIDPEYPMIRLTIALVQRTAGLIFVTGEDGKLLGEISIKNIVHKVLRG